MTRPLACQTGGVSAPSESSPAESSPAESIWRRLRARITDSAALRGWAVDANDGIIATAGLLEGFAAAGADDSLLIRAATAATIAGALSMGGVKWAEESAEREAQLRLVAEESAELAADPDNEIAELTAYWEGKGLTPEVARQVAEQLSAHDALAAQLESEHGIDEIMPASAPIWAGVSSALAFALGAVVPLGITLFVPVAIEAWVILFAVVAALVLTSIIAARTAHLSVVRTLTRTLVVGIGTLALSYIAGLVLF